jgi:hypothetical protein
VIHGNGEVETYIVSEILRYQAYEPNSIYSDFIQVDNNNERIKGTFATADDLFLKIYGEKDRLVLQTCIDGNGEAEGRENWGRLFVIAIPTN